MNPPATRYIDPSARIGFPIRPLQGFVQSLWEPHGPEPELPEKIYVGPFAIIGEYVRLGERVIIDEYCKVGRGTVIGDDTLIIYRSNIGADAQIGDNCVIGAVVSENCKIGRNCKVFGRIIHKHENSAASWDHSPPEPSVEIKDHSFVGFDAILAGGITVGPRAYICAGAVITKDIPSDHIAFGRNEIIHFTSWKGALRNNPIFKK